MIEFIYDHDAYATMFEGKFPKSKTSKTDKESKPYGCRRNKDSESQLHSIDYEVDYLLADDPNKMVFNLLNLLSTSENMCYFRSRFIQRMINHQWDNFYRQKYMRVLAIHIFIYLLILLDISTLNLEARSVCQARIGINCLNAVPMIGLIMMFELKKRRKKDKNIWLGFLYFFTFLVASILDGFSCWTVDYEPYDDPPLVFFPPELSPNEADQEPGWIEPLARLLRPRP